MLLRGDYAEYIYEKDFDLDTFNIDFLSSTLK
jgi:hypothetical protein